MAEPSASACARIDDSFGPHALDCRGGFDFTLLFEETILGILPHAFVLLILPLRLWFLWLRTKKVECSGIHIATVKITAWVALAALNLAALVLWTNPSAVSTRASVPAAAVKAVSALGFSLLSYAEHTRTVRPSSILSVFSFFTLLFDVALARTLCLRADDEINDTIGYISIAAVAVKASVLVFEALDKRQSLRPAYQGYPPEATSGIYNRAFFWWLNPLFRKGFKRVLDVDELFALDKHLTSSYWEKRFLAGWSPAAGKSPYSLLVSSFVILKRHLLHTILPRACLTALIFCQPFLINRTILLTEEPVNNDTSQAGYGLIGAYLLVYAGIAVAMGQYQHRIYRTITMVRAGLVSIIYRKTGSLQLGDVDPASSMTLMSADMERIVQGWQTMHEIWANLIEVAVAIYLLEQQLGVACVVPVAVSIVSLLGSMIAMNFIMSRQAMWLEAIERRISATSAMLASMKGIKMCGLKDTLINSLQALRVDELHISKRFRKLLIWNMVFAYVTQVFAPVLTFAVFSVRARDTGDMTLDTARVFTSLSLFALLSEPLASLVMSLATFLGAAGSFTRIQQFLQSSERVDTRKLTKSAADAIKVEGAAFSWDAAKEPQLIGVTLTIPWKKLTMIVGPVGCGKTTLLHALLGEIPLLEGSVKLGSRSIAYCAQNPWHGNGTIREAIVSGAFFDEKWYERVVRDCALTRDLEELPMGDSTRIGSGGIALSGGQSQRIALARAIYARRDILILDDVLSGLDTSTENHVFENLLGNHGILRELGTTVVLVSSSAKRLPYSDHIICLGADGKLSGEGSFADLNNAGGFVNSLSLSRTEKGQESNDATSKVHRGSFIQRDKPVEGVLLYSKEKQKRSSETSRSSSETLGGSPHDAEAQMSRQTGDMQIYLYYVKSVGLWASLIFVVAIAGFVFCISFPNVWVQWWAADNEARPNSRLDYWLGVYAALGGAAIVCLSVSCWQIFITMVPRTGERFHLAMLKTVLSAPMTFFVNTDSGVTINRFSQDLQLIDMELPIAALNTFTTFILCIAQMALIGYGSIYAAVSFPIVLFILYLIQKVYLRTSRQLRLMDLETKAPLYGLFEESLRGLATIRALGWQQTFQEKNHVLLDRSQRPFYLLFAVQRWLTLVLDLLIAGVAVLLIILVVELRGTVSAGGVGLALVGVIQFSQNVKLLVTFWTTLETHIGSVARIKNFTETTKAEDQPGENSMPPADWPSAGAIELRNLSAAYGERTTDNLVLKDVTLSIKAGEKIGICGRTGSGKTSLIMSLFRLVDVQGGSISVDGLDLASLPREQVRRRIVGVPQQAFLLKGSVRLNADPTGEASDEAILDALESVQLSDLVEKHGGLDADIDALNLSSGQQQLFSLARALLRPSSILILDEATSSIDVKTEEVMQRLIRKRFANRTIIAVAHKLDTIMDFDKVAVLDAGRLVEFDSPYALLEKPQSAFSKLYNASVSSDVDAF